MYYNYGRVWVTKYGVNFRNYNQLEPTIPLVRYKEEPKGEEFELKIKNSRLLAQLYAKNIDRLITTHKQCFEEMEICVRMKLKKYDYEFVNDNIEAIFNKNSDKLVKEMIDRNQLALAALARYEYFYHTTYAISTVRTVYRPYLCKKNLSADSKKNMRKTTFDRMIFVRPKRLYYSHRSRLYNCINLDKSLYSRASNPYRLTTYHHPSKYKTVLQHPVRRNINFYNFFRADYLQLYQLNTYIRKFKGTMYRPRQPLGDNDERVKYRLKLKISNANADLIIQVASKQQGYKPKSKCKERIMFEQSDDRI